MKLFRYRRPSLKTVLGISQAKRKFTRATGGAAVRHPKVILTNAERRVKRRVGYYSAPAKAVRNRRHFYLGPFKLWWALKKSDSFRRRAYRDLRRNLQEDVTPWPVWLRLAVLAGAGLFLLRIIGVI